MTSVLTVVKVCMLIGVVVQLKSLIATSVHVWDIGDVVVGPSVKSVWIISRVMIQMHISSEV